jgi:hypothetical protein
LKDDHPQLYRRGTDGQDLGFAMGAAPLRRIVLGRGARTAVLVLFAAVGLVLLIACANTAQFLMARAIERRPEVVLRSALGASSGRLMRQFLTEAFLFAAVASALGVLQASALVGVLRALIGSPSPLVGQLGLNLQVILFTVIGHRAGDDYFWTLPGAASRAAASGRRRRVAAHRHHALAHAPRDDRGAGRRPRWCCSSPRSSSRLVSDSCRTRRPDTSPTA